jgi:hypothetical protein
VQFHIIKTKRFVISIEGFYALETKNRREMSSEGNAARQLLATAAQIGKAVWPTFFKEFEFARSGVAARC